MLANHKRLWFNLRRNCFVTGSGTILPWNFWYLPAYSFNNNDDKYDKWVDATTKNFINHHFYVFWLDVFNSFNLQKNIASF